MTGYDVLAVLILIVSAAFGFVRGGAREIVSLFSALAALLAAFLAWPATAPVGRALFDPDWLGAATALLFVFVVVYAALRLFAAWASRRLQETERLGGLDRGVGLGFGVVRGLALIGAAHLAVHAVTPPDRTPGWFRNAAIYPVGVASARTIQAFLPKFAKVADRTAPVVKESAVRGATARPQSVDTDAAGYDQRSRGELDALVEQSR